MNYLHYLAYALLWIGGLNWGLVGLFDVDLVQMLFGGMPALADLVYVLVGASALYTLVTHKATCTVCGKEKEKEE